MYSLASHAEGWQHVLVVGEDVEQQHSNSLVCRRDWQELESGRSMEEHTLAAAAPPASSAVRARGALLLPRCLRGAS